MWQVKLGIVSALVMGVADSIPFDPAWLQGGSAAVLGVVVVMLLKMVVEQQKRIIEMSREVINTNKENAESQREVGKALNNLSTTCKIAQSKRD